MHTFNKTILLALLVREQSLKDQYNYQTMKPFLQNIPLEIKQLHQMKLNFLFAFFCF